LFHVAVIAFVGTPELVDTVIHLDFFKIQHGPGTSFLHQTTYLAACECPSATALINKYSILFGRYPFLDRSNEEAAACVRLIAGKL
jgi:hypothetical protein